MIELKRGPWRLSDLDQVEKNGAKVFSIFSCGGGSTMGYKLAGYEVVGCCEIDPEMLSIYRANHRPRLPFLMGVQQFNERLKTTDLAPELADLDILDGSPPCSSFSVAGSREKAWGKKKKFREGQADQVLDDLFFHFIETARLLRPKVVIAENVKGLVLGQARGYVKEIFAGFRAAGYETQLFLLNAAAMGVPQRRERTFFVSIRSDLNMPRITLDFREDPIPFSAIKEAGAKAARLSDHAQWLWNNKIDSDKNIGEINARLRGKASNFNTSIVHDRDVLPTIVSGATKLLHSEPRAMSELETIRAQTFPDNYDFGKARPRYVCGMSVPPFMMQRVADQVWKQWLGHC
ncbi:MAG: DNA (cytosine-5-)-methyltransferase [Pseudomonadota bacterium]